MSRIADAWNVLTGRASTKAGRYRPPLLEWGWTAGTGIRFVPPGSQHDYQREAGDLWRSSVVSIAIRWIVRQFLQAPFKAGYEDAEGNYQAIPEHPLVELLERCNATWPGRQTWAGVIGDFCCYGNAYLHKGNNEGGVPVELFWLPARYITIEPDDANAAAKLYKFASGGKRDKYTPEEVIHFRDEPDPDNPLVGLGKIQSQIRNVAAINAGERWTASVLRNGTAGKAVSPKVSVEKVEMGGLPDEAAMEAQARAIRTRAGKEAAGSIMALNLPVELLDLGESPEKMLVDRILDRPESMILAALGLNALALDLPSSASTRTYANKAESRREAWEHCVIPLQDAIADTLQRQLLPDFGDPALEVWFDRKDVPALREDANDRMQRAVQAFSNTLLTRNASLSVAGLDPLPPGDPDGDRYYGEPTAAQEEQAQQQMQSYAQQMQANADAIQMAQDMANMPPDAAIATENAA